MRPASWMARLRTELRDLAELVLLPGLAALLPWPLAYKVLRRLAGIRALYRDASERALQEAAARGWLADAPHWARVRRLVTLVDHADYYLGRWRGDRWMDRYLDVEGAWPPPGQAAILCTFHWGAGMWGLRHAHRSGLRPHALVAALHGPHFAGRSVLHWYARARTAEVARALGAPALETSASLRPALQALKGGGQVLAAIDVPADQVAASLEVDLAGGKARLPSGLLRVAVQQQLPVYVYLTGIRLDSGRRTLRILRIEPTADLQALAQRVFAHLDAAIRADPPAWHFWSEAPRFFAR